MGTGRVWLHRGSQADRDEAGLSSTGGHRQLGTRQGLAPPGGHRCFRTDIATSPGSDSILVAVVLPTAPTSGTSRIQCVRTGHTGGTAGIVPQPVEGSRPPWTQQWQEQPAAALDGCPSSPQGSCCSTERRAEAAAGPHSRPPQVERVPPPGCEAVLTDGTQGE